MPSEEYGRTKPRRSNRRNQTVVRLPLTPVAVPEEITAAVTEMTQKSGHQFRVSEKVVEGTQLYVVYAPDHPFPEHYTVASGTLGFRVPQNFPDASPEDCFFLLPNDVKLKVADLVTGNVNINRAGEDPNFLKGTELGGKVALVFSWHLWDRRPWNRRKHTLFDHYAHCLRRFEQNEHY